MKPFFEFVGVVGIGRHYLNEDELREIGDFTRENIHRWIDSQTGPTWITIVPVEDFHAVCGDRDIPWATEEGKKIWNRIKDRLEKGERPDQSRSSSS